MLSLYSLTSYCNKAADAVTKVALRRTLVGLPLTCLDFILSASYVINIFSISTEQKHKQNTLVLFSTYTNEQFL